MTTTQGGLFTRRRLAGLISSHMGLIAGGLGSIFYVNSEAGTDAAGWGGTPTKPVATLTYALGLCTADKGDVIICLAGHTQEITAAGGVDVNKAGVTVTGTGNGSLKSSFSFSTDTAATFKVSAQNVKIDGLRFDGGVDDLATMLDLTESGCTIEDCDFYTSSTVEALSFIKITTTKDNFIFRNCRFYQPTDPTGTDGAAGTGCIYVVDSENILIEDCTFDGFFETAVLHNKTTALKRLVWRRNSVQQLLTTTGLRLRLVAGVSQCSIAPDNDFVPGLGYKVTKIEDCATATKDALFTVGGKVLVTLWESEVTTVLVGAGPTDYVLGIDSGCVMTATSDIHAAAAGFMFQMTGDPADTALTAGSNGGLAVVKASDCDTSGLSNRVLGLRGLGTLTLSATRTAASSGNITHTLWYIPLEHGAYVVDAA